MRVSFTPRRSSQPNYLMAEAEVYFDAEGPFHAMKLAGFTIWRDRDGGEGYYVTFPARPDGAGSERRYFDFLRPADPFRTPEGQAAVSRVKEWLMREWDLAGRPGVVAA